MSLSSIKDFDRVLNTNADILAYNIIGSAKAASRIHSIVEAVIQGVIQEKPTSEEELKNATDFLKKIEEINKEINKKAGGSPLSQAIKDLSRKLEEPSSVASPPLAPKPPESPGHKIPSPPPGPKPPPKVPSPPSGPKPFPASLPGDKVPSPSPVKISLPDLAPTSKVSSLRGRFEPAQAAPKPPGVERAAPKILIGIKPASFDSIKEKTKGLDLGDRELSEKIKGIQSDLKKLKESGGVSNEQMQTLNNALDLLHSITSFKPFPFEMMLLEHLAQKYPNLEKALHDFPDIMKRMQQEGKSQMFKIIKESLDKPDSLVTNISKKRKQLETDLIKLRFSSLPPALRNSPPFNKNFIQNLPELLQAFEKFSESAFKSLKDSWEKHLAEIDQVSEGEFSKVLQKLPSYNPAEHYEELLNRLQAKYLRLLDLNALNDSDSIKTYIDSFTRKAEEHASGIFDKAYEFLFKRRHLWLATNYDHVEKSYDQSRALDTNLGAGVCYHNSLARLRKLLIKPDLRSEEIEMGSSASSRVAQTKYKHEYNAAKRKGAGALTREEITKVEEEITKVEIDSAKQAGLNLIKEVAVPYNKDNPTKNLGAALDQAYQDNGQKVLALFSLYAPGAGHAINIQMDSSTGQFRFMDDNFGICGKYNSYEAFKEAFVTYLQVSYKEYSIFSLAYYNTTS